MKLNYYKSTIFCRRKVQMGLNVFTPREKMKFFFWSNNWISGIPNIVNRWLELCLNTSISNTILGTKKQFCYILFSFVKTKKNGTLWMSYILANIFFKLQIKNVLFDNKIQLSENLIDDILAKMTDANRDGKYKYACWFILWRKIKRRISVISCKVRDSWKFILVLASLIAVTFEIFA